MIVLDASVVVKWVKPDEVDSNLALALYKSHLEGREEIIVPTSLFYEIANTLATDPEVSNLSIKKGLTLISESGLSVYKEDIHDLVKAAILAKKHKTSIYDMLYVVIAKNKKLNLITADEKFLGKTKFRNLKLLKDLKM